MDYKVIAVLFSLLFLFTGCVKTVYKTEVKYVRPEVPDSMIAPCEEVTMDGVQTNGDLLMSYISLHSAYSICSAKVNSIRLILQSYDEIYNAGNSQSQSESDAQTTE